MKTHASGSFVVAVMCLGIVGAASSASAVDGESGSMQAAVMAGLNAAAMAKLSVAEKRVSSGQWVESNEAAGYVPASDAPADVSVGRAGVITVMYTRPADLAGASIVLTPSAGDRGVVKWSCAGSGVPAEALPNGCK
jgi:hypothetical protein